MQKKHFIKILAGALLVCGLAAAPVTSNAATPEEAEAIARSLGVSEENIQAAWNQYNADPDKYPPEVIDDMIQQLYESKGKIVSVVPYSPGVSIPALTTVTTASPEPSATTAVQDPAEETTAAAGTSENSGNTGSSGNNGSAGNTGSSGNTGNSQGGSEIKSTDITLTAADGTEFTRVSKEQFISLTYDEKLAYLGTFPADQQEVIIANLSPEEYKSLLKQLPTDQKAEVLDTLSGITDDLGLTMTVDELTDDSVKISLRDESGELKAVAEAGKLVEDTGYDRRGIIALCGGLLTLAMAGLAVLIHRCFGEETDDEG